MNERIVELLEFLNVRKSDIHALLDAENEDVDIKAIADRVTDVVFDERKNDMLDFANKKLAAKLNSEFGLGLTRREAEQSNLNDIVAAVREKTEQTKGEVDTSELDALRDKIAAIGNERDELKKRIDETKSEYEQRIRKIRTTGMVDSEFARVDWGVPDSQRRFFQKGIKNDILQQYTIDDDGVLKSVDGGKAYATTSDGKTVPLKNLSDAVNFYVAELGVQRKSNGTANGGEHTADASNDDERQLSDTARDLRQRALAQAEKAAKMRERIN